MKNRMEPYYRALWATAAVFLVFLTGSLVFVYSLGRQNDSRSIEYLQDATAQQSNALRQQLHGDLQVLNGVAVALGSMDLEQPGTIEAILYSINRTNTFEWMGLADAQGNLDVVDMAGRKLRGLDVADLPVFGRALDGKAGVSPSFDDARTGERVNYYAVPVRQNRQVVAVLCAISREEVLRSIISVPVLQGAGYYALIDRSGVIMGPTVDPDPRVYVGASIYDSISFRGGDRSRMERALTYGQEEDFVFYVNAVEQLSVVQPLGVNGWSVISVVPHHTITSYYNRTALGTSIIILAASVVFGFLMYRQIRIMARAQETLETLAYTDPLTGARNYTKFVLDAEAILKAHPDKRFAFWSYDIKRFNTINELLGSDVGDKVLQRVSHHFEQSEQNSLVPSAFCHLAADQFAGLRCYETEQELVDWFLAFHSALSENRKIIPGNRMLVDAVIGFYCPDAFEEALPVEDMVNCAAIAKKAAKNDPGTKYLFFDAKMRDALRWESEIEAEARRGLENGEFLFYLQPKVSIRNGFYIEGAEALVRWIHPEHGFMPPGAFIPLFEKTGFVVELDRAIFEQVCRWYAEQRAAGCPPIHVAVNVSRKGILRKDFLSYYVAIKKQYGIEDGVLELEFTEGVIQDDYTLFKGTVMELQHFGISCSIDDFGSGYSSLNVLKNLPIDVLKLDAVFFRDSGDVRRERVVVGDFISLACKLGIKTVAEGVETPDQVAFLQEAGADMIQGYVFSKPLPTDDFLALLTAHGGEVFLPEESDGL